MSLKKIVYSLGTGFIDRGHRGGNRMGGGGGFVDQRGNRGSYGQFDEGGGGDRLHGNWGRGGGGNRGGGNFNRTRPDNNRERRPFTDDLKESTPGIVLVLLKIGLIDSSEFV